MGIVRNPIIKQIEAFRCLACGATTEYRRGQLSKLAHAPRCCHCGGPTENVRNLAPAKRSRNAGGVRPFACSFCGQRFRGEGARDLHRA